MTSKAMQQKQVLKCLACILTIGNLKFEQNEKDEAYITNRGEWRVMVRVCNDVTLTHSYTLTATRTRTRKHI